MIYRCLRLALLCGALVFSFAACDDPSSVGAGVGSTPLKGGKPETIDISPDPFETEVAPAETGNNNVLQSWRVLVGTVHDPLVGTLAADGYVDIDGLATLPDDFFALPPEQLTAQLKLVRSYVHGDTTSALDVAVYDVTEEMEVTDATADQTFPVEAAPIRTATFQANDSLVTIDLPPAWITEHLEVLRDTTNGGASFEDAFHGFRLETAGGDAVVGFDRSTARLELGGVPDTVSTIQYRSEKLFSHITRTEAVPPPDGRRVLVDGVGAYASLNFSFDTPPLDTLRNAPVNRADLVLPVDTLAWREKRPDHFVRPRERVGYRILGIRADDSPSCAALNTATESETTCVLPLVEAALPSAALADPTTGLVLFQESLLQGRVFSELQMQIAVDRATGNTLGVGLPSTLPVVLFAPTAEAEDDRPRASLTITDL